MKIKRELKQLVNKLNDEVYFTTDPPVFDIIDDRYWDNKYFICWVGTKRVLYVTKTQDELIDWLKEIKAENDGLTGIGAGYYVNIFESEK